MRAFEFFDDPYQDEEYPEDLAKIIEYLEAQGKINVNLVLLSDYYRDFSENCYAAGWMALDDSTIITAADESILYEFAKWLSMQEI